jgi:hypothetical protein
MKPRRAPAPYWNPYVAGILLGVVLFFSFFLTGHGLGASGGLARALFALEARIVPGYIDTHPYLGTRLSK